MGSGSDSEVSVSSLIFLNHSSGSDDSAGETEAGMETSAVELEHSEIPSEDLNHNIWRLYFGSSFELELGHHSPSELVRITVVIITRVGQFLTYENDFCYSAC